MKKIKIKIKLKTCFLKRGKREKQTRGLPSLPDPQSKKEKGEKK
jgi:hypothetical protein